MRLLRPLIVTFAVCLVAACATTPSSTRSDTPRQARLPVPTGGQRLTDDAVLLPGRFVLGEQPDGNSVLLAAPEGLVVVDTGRHAAHTQAILAAATAAQRPVAVVLNTHWHLDHVGGNPRIRAAYPAVKVVASAAIEGAMGGFLKGYRTQLGQANAKANTEAERERYRTEVALIDSGRALYPDVRVAASGERTLAGRRFYVGFESDAVTAGDLWLLDREHRLLIAGDLVTLPAPFLDTACPKRWQATLARLESQPWDRLVPGHGPVLDRDDFARYRRGFDGLLACAATRAPVGECAAGWHREIDPLLRGANEREAADKLLQYYLNQVLRGPDAIRKAKLCPAA
jgi:glyoxylase-like metal-dependent hydrolase (beta-lactamase superfamily II)